VCSSDLFAFSQAAEGIALLLSQVIASLQQERN